MSGALRKLRRAGAGGYDVEPLHPEGSLPRGFAIEKMSEVILEFAAPILDEADDSHRRRLAIAFAVMCWDIALLPEDRQEAELDHFLKNVVGPDPSMVPEMKQEARRLIARKKALYPNNKRFVLDYKFVDEGDDYNLYVISMVFSDELQPPRLPVGHY